MINIYILTILRTNACVILMRNATEDKSEFLYYLFCSVYTYLLFRKQ